MEAKEFLKKIINKFGYQINRYGKSKVLVDRLDWIPYKNKNSNFNLYFEGLKKSENEASDNFAKQLRFYSLIQMVEKILKHHNVYDFVECGCWKGHSSYIISHLINKTNKKVKFHIFDSFEGLSNSTKKDGEFYLKSEKQKNSTKEYFRSSENFVKNIVLKDFNFIKTYKGWIPERFDEVKDRTFSFVHIDVDLYQPTYDSLEFFFPRLNKGGSIVCDDYNSSTFPGAKEAWDEYFKSKSFEHFYESPFGGCFLIK
tara:strand:- start:38 stop:805 length:768 start_codon:yes stop_codon:yes gene_type:complete